ncbi:6-phosphogluconate dehydrogenase [Candidatus Woesearchaeota archaeon]|jgi:6-phosphogluconate dehydrogenase|nr:6-phosphogluconate dehydrogenase [Candidatus Woesearchaeota archaeon]|tara:strand:- start:2148 stop:3038 length:891 start_codon:yes stop_codon:yes gene_type:complete
MKIGFIGLGRMGFFMVERLLQHKIEVVAHNRSPEKVDEIAKKGAIPAHSVDELLQKLEGRKIIWLMLPAGKATDEVMKKILPKLSKNDILIDGANDFYGNAERHSKECSKYGVNFFDCGVSGGIWGLKNGYTLMVGGPKDLFKEIEPLCKALSPKESYGYFGEAGAGHFVKSVHNIVEYVYLQGIAEGVEILSKFKQEIDINKAVHIWRPASVVRSWLMDLTDNALGSPDFKDILPVNNSVTINELRETSKSVNAYAPAFEIAANIREDKSDKFVLGKRTIAAVRNQFGGHKVEKK